MNRATQIAIPTLVRLKPGALDRLGLYLSRAGHRRIAMLFSHGLVPELRERAKQSFADHGIELVQENEVIDASFEHATQRFGEIDRQVQAIVGLGGGKALDVAKYAAFLGRLPYYAVPTSLSNDGFCSPQSSLTLQGRRKSLAAAIPYGVVLDTEVCRNAPTVLTLSGVGDLMAKLTAVFDWKLAFEHTGELVNDFAALLSDNTVSAFLARESLDAEGLELLGTALMFNGIAMEICGSSRPASGSEHLISHALDLHSSRPRLHGLQVGVATYLMSLLQQNQSDRIAQVFAKTGFWDAIADDPFIRAEWLHAVSIAPTIKQPFFTILSIRDQLPEVERLLHTDPVLLRCFRD
ncbi:iron-containing alcohol dehydrogenase family protein [Tuwongella immobilis]|uniref:Alcohol dehydrogenase iron-type/glycerol dehydrogenase GldA domain-containing protein n=1 Tax=Tuwongella immobilis TaxID=692036 RepID=A0A6C2YI96_9BACT|nr:iron-containing alcohol dehydrogenase family protein [Tuwongella immobilis]VIP00863.1 dehydrogenase : Glycerol-1-phosphate dehydrogenase (NAD(P)(+)) OS=Desulfovibrio vulgaris subsp. vulgaris (strain DP4) GN=Dvul_3015 PE=4 SV=1: Fe-ADH_2 [Tuwongella immobilis]VTR97144.1 dehydrogenase : Glycerol-1-phosphate dehydrogenase (NAD(P)(+)) OS=Desulfovibrio vulgaris subsp. vulgaris (strain DP4) GN=Dvul_3015 PE=4 SV=1: Fe-ADH_2 [Tuwongella immobilis]